jgi:nucleotide-binding universal stress UspA family protein
MATQHFLVPIDFSEYANQALDDAITLAGKLGARVTLLHVMQSLPPGGVDMSVTLPATYFQDLEAAASPKRSPSWHRVQC